MNFAAEVNIPNEIVNHSTFVIAGDGPFYITANGVALTDTYGAVRYFRTRNAARKRISRERLGDYHN